MTTLSTNQLAFVESQDDEKAIELLVVALKKRRIKLCEARIKAAADADTSERDVHTEHCCKEHGCKYGQGNCTVTSGKKAQSFPCETCTWDNEF